MNPLRRLIERDPCLGIMAGVSMIVLAMAISMYLVAFVGAICIWFIKLFY
jgi:hypothetical protein